MHTYLLKMRNEKVKRDSYNGILGGVCEGLGEYFSIDPSNDKTYIYIPL